VTEPQHAESVRAEVDGEILDGVLCPTCGSLVFEEVKHMTWHERLTGLAAAVEREIKVGCAICGRRHPHTTNCVRAARIDGTDARVAQLEVQVERLKAALRAPVPEL
jgi:predicted  nucleic acid-binding Zn-ribbon protein